MTDVLVVGAGPTGLTLACLLRRHGIDVRVVDRLTEPVDQAKALFIWSRSLEILEGIGVASAAVTAGISLKCTRYLQGPRLLACLRTDRIPGTRWQPLGLPQAILERLLRERLQGLGCDVCWGTEVTALEIHGDGVSATVVKADGSTERCNAAYVVGCDGLRSVVRTAAQIGWRNRGPYEEIFQLGDVEADTCLDANTVYGFLGRTGASIAIPMPGGLMRIAGYFAGEKPDRAPDRETLQRLLDEVGHKGTTITDVHWSGTYRVSRRLAGDFRAGRLLLAGDAAHVHSPAGGLGLNTGIQDANNLAWKLALVVRGVADEKLLDSYTTERRAIAARILTITEMQDKWLFGTRSLLSRTARNTVMRCADRSGVLERKLVPNLAQVKIRYKDSPLSVNGGGGRRGAYVPGGQVPEVAFIAADGAGPVALRDPEPDGAIALVAVPGLRRENGLTDIESLASDYPGTLRLRPVVAPLPREDAARSGLLIGVRPDGYIAYRGPCEVTPALRAWINKNVAPPVAFAGRCEPRTRSAIE